MDPEPKEAKGKCGQAGQEKGSRCRRVLGRGTCQDRRGAAVGERPWPGSQEGTEGGRQWNGEARVLDRPSSDPSTTDEDGRAGERWRAGPEVCRW